MKRPGRYAKEFKIEAVRLLKLGEKPASELALELGVKRYWVNGVTYGNKSQQRK
jgi:transposase-like protein